MGGAIFIVYLKIIYSAIQYWIMSLFYMYTCFNLLQVKETLGMGKQESSESSSSSAKDGKQSADGEDKKQQSEYGETAETIFSKVRSGVSSSFQMAKDAKVLDFAKKGYNIVKDELNGSPNKRRRAQAASAAASQANVERSTRTDLTIVPVKQSRFSKKWEAFKAKVSILLSSSRGIFSFQVFFN